MLNSLSWVLGGWLGSSRCWCAFSTPHDDGSSDSAAPARRMHKSEQTSAQSAPAQSSAMGRSTVKRPLARERSAVLTPQPRGVERRPALEERARTNTHTHTDLSRVKAVALIPVLTFRVSTIRMSSTWPRLCVHAPPCMGHAYGSRGDLWPPSLATPFSLCWRASSEHAAPAAGTRRQSERASSAALVRRDYAGPQGGAFSPPLPVCWLETNC